ncbi:MAG: hypothetical protein GXP19_02165 [Gammaproteobacteria bacterium]|nr:hypothetical protein [Gammaproteobacteria bacterium]
MQPVTTKRRTLKWMLLLAMSAIVLFLRVVDFVLEAANEGFHVTRIGFNLIGMNAFVLQLGIIVVSIMLAWVAFVKLSNLHLRTISSSSNMPLKASG